MSVFYHISHENKYYIEISNRIFHSLSLSQYLLIKKYI